MVERENLAVLKANNKQAKSPKLERPHPPKVVSMHFTSTSTCMNFLSLFYFLTPWTILVHGPKGNFGHFEGKGKWGKISNTKNALPTKIGAHEYLFKLYVF